MAPTPPLIGGGAATEAALRAFISETCLAPGDPGLEDDEPLLTNGILDSLGIMRLAVFIEETFGVNVADEALVPENFGSLRRVAALIERLEASDPAPPQDPVLVGG
jgi:acyl carrier protein